MKSQLQISTLADVGYIFRRCSGCCDELPQSTKVEVFHSVAPRSVWIVAECPRCGRCTPFQIETFEKEA